jgi:multiple antibiotic resistance protein
MTESLTRGQRRQFLAIGMLVMIVGYLAAIWVGSELLSLLGVTTPMLNAAGGMVVIALAFLMVLGSKKHPEAEEKDIGAVQEDDSWRTKAVVPFGLPLVVGGGTIAYLITATNQFQSTSASKAMSIVGLVYVAIMWISLGYAVPLSRRLGDTGTQVIARFFGFVLLAIGWNILTKGLIELIPGLAG